MRLKLHRPSDGAEKIFNTDQDQAPIRQWAQGETLLVVANYGSVIPGLERLDQYQLPAVQNDPRRMPTYNANARAIHFDGVDDFLHG